MIKDIKKTGMLLISKFTLYRGVITLGLLTIACGGGDNKQMLSVSQKQVSQDPVKEKELLNPKQFWYKIEKQMPEFDPQTIKELKEWEIVLCIGKTGAGKTTTCKYLSGQEMKKHKNHKSQYVYEAVDDKLPGKIGHTKKSQTICPQLFVNKKSKIALVDCPGFADTRGNEQEAINLSLIKSFAYHSKKILGVAIVIGYDDFIADRGGRLKGYLDYLTEFFNSNLTMSDTYWFITKAPLEIEDPRQTCILEMQESLEVIHSNYEELKEIYNEGWEKEKDQEDVNAEKQLERLLKHKDNIFGVNLLDQKGITEIFDVIIKNNQSNANKGKKENDNNIEIDKEEKRSIDKTIQEDESNHPKITADLISIVNKHGKELQGVLKKIIGEAKSFKNYKKKVATQNKLSEMIISNKSLEDTVVFIDKLKKFDSSDKEKAVNSNNDFKEKNSSIVQFNERIRVSMNNIKNLEQTIKEINERKNEFKHYRSVEKHMNSYYFDHTTIADYNDLPYAGPDTGFASPMISTKIPGDNCYSSDRNVTDRNNNVTRSVEDNIFSIKLKKLKCLPDNGIYNAQISLHTNHRDRLISKTTDDLGKVGILCGAVLAFGAVVISGGAALPAIAGAAIAGGVGGGVVGAASGNLGSKGYYYFIEGEVLGSVKLDFYVKREYLDQDLLTNTQKKLQDENENLKDLKNNLEIALTAKNEDLIDQITKNKTKIDLKSKELDGYIEKVDADVSMLKFVTYTYPFLFKNDKLNLKDYSKMYREEVENTDQIDYGNSNAIDNQENDENESIIKPHITSPKYTKKK